MDSKQVCRSDFRGDGSIPKELTEKWEKFIEKACRSVNCKNRYKTRCCVWGNFMDLQNK